MLGFFVFFLEIVVKPTSNELIARAYDDDDDKDDDYEDDEEDGQVNVHVTAFGDHAQNTGIYSRFCSLNKQLAVNHVVIIPPPPTHPPPGHNCKTTKNAEKQRLTPGAWRRG